MTGEKPNAETDMERIDLGLNAGTTDDDSVVIEDGNQRIEMNEQNFKQIVDVVGDSIDDGVALVEKSLIRDVARALSNESYHQSQVGEQTLADRYSEKSAALVEHLDTDPR